MKAWLTLISGTFVRAGLIWIASRLVEHGIWAQGDVAGYVAGGTTAIVALGWSLAEKYGARVSKLVALWLPKGSTENDVKAYIADGKPTPAITTPPDTAPGVPTP
jgi:hypothetical protein